MRFSPRFSAFPFIIISILAALLIFEACKRETKNANWKYQDNTVRVRLANDPDAINPLLSRNSYSRYVHERIFLPLMDYNPKTLVYEPVLVKAAPTAVEVTESPYAGGMAYTYEIRDEATWDDGSPITAADIDFTVKLLFVPGMPTAAYRAYFEFIKDIQMDPTNPRKFTFVVDKMYILNEGALGSIMPYPAHIYDPEGVLKNYALSQLNAPDADKKFSNNEDLKVFVSNFTAPKHAREKAGISGSGPYAFDRWETGQFLLLTKKPNWWGQKFASSALFAAEPDSLLFKIIVDQTAAVTALKDQEIDVSAGIDTKDFVDIQRNELVKANYNLYAPNASQIYLIYLNTKDPKLSDKKVRRALAHLTDVNEFINTIYYGLAERVNGPLDPWQDYIDKSIKPIEYNVEKAKTLLAEAGWTDSNNNGTVDKTIDGKLQEMEVDIQTPTSKAVQDICLLFQNSLQKAGIKANIITKDFKEVIGEVRKKNYQIYPGAMSVDLEIDDPKQQWHTESDNPAGSNYTGFGNADTDALIERLRITLDPAKRNDLYKEFQSKLQEEQPAIFLFSPKERIAIHKRFKAETSLKRPGFFPNTFQQAD